MKVQGSLHLLLHLRAPAPIIAPLTPVAGIQLLPPAANLICFAGRPTLAVPISLETYLFAPVANVCK